MGYDIYMCWPDRTEEERQRQITGYEVSKRAGGAGYLREAWSHGIFATQHFLWEAYFFTVFPHYRAGSKERLDEEFAVMSSALKKMVEEGDSIPPYTGVLLESPPDFNPDPRVERAQYQDEGRDDPIDVAVYPSGVLRERLAYGCAVAHYRGMILYDDPDGDPHQEEAFTAFVGLAQHLEEVSRGPAMVYVH